jgi:hypothetical protein
VDETIVLIYRRLVLECQCSAETILEDPGLRDRFLTDTRQTLGRDVPEFQLLHRLSYLRKQRRLPRSKDICSAG